jgi:hypothetical protein
MSSWCKPIYSYHGMIFCIPSLGCFVKVFECISNRSFGPIVLSGATSLILDCYQLELLAHIIWLSGDIDNRYDSSSWLYMSSIDLGSSICETYFGIVYKLLDINQVSIDCLSTLNARLVLNSMFL